MKSKSVIYLITGALLGAGVTATLAARAADAAPAAPTALQPLDALMATIEKKYNGRVTDVELERRPWGDFYEIEVVDSSHEEWDLDVDARTGEILREKRDRD